VTLRRRIWCFGIKINCSSVWWWFLNRISFSDCSSSIQLSVVLLRSFHTVLVIVHLASASCLAPGPASFLACCLVSGSFRSLPCVWPIYKLVVLWESSVVTGRRKLFAVDLKGSRRVQLASWRNLILTFRTCDLIRQFVRRSGTFVDSGRSSVRSIGAFLEGLDLIWRQAYIEALVWFDLMFDLIDPVELICCLVVATVLCWLPSV
jgi:hypothetical protein